MMRVTVLIFALSAGLGLSGAALADETQPVKSGQTSTTKRFDPLIWAETALGNRVDLSAGALPNGSKAGPFALSAAVPFVDTRGIRFSFVGALAWDADLAQKSRYSLGAVAPVAALEARYRNAYLRAVPSEALDAETRLNFGLTIPLK
ncbi:hypothetical protein [Ruegeria aquimaris]|uniref:Uncharacterized protein n=1 Tax=Ruegeria aquimaris TaxID=2984333 RepID=A0ABT3AE43_9RHOB|nr:hypothetical protein [Ruegeria sp. XHP0148]MCV2886938.1 hypothetical protein [Ruegeria sp. XHP0148]